MSLDEIAVIVIVALAVIGTLWAILFRRVRGTADRALEPQQDHDERWQADDVPGSLDRVLSDVESAALSAAGWYWKAKIPKARASRFIRAASIFLTVAAGLLPVAIELVAKVGGNQANPWWATGLWATVLVGAAGGLIGLDRAFGFSSAWTRYVLAATEITRRLAEFKMDWLASMAAAGGAPSTPEQIAALLQKAKDFRIAIEGIVVQETKDWATEFQNNLAQLEKDVKAQLDTLKTQVEQARKHREDASAPASLAATVPNADKAQSFTFFVTLESVDQTIVKDEKVVNSKSWSRLGLRAGQHKLTVSADTVATGTQASIRVSRSTVLTIKPGEVNTVSIDLPID
jgi:hypothetical protein